MAARWKKLVPLMLTQPSSHADENPLVWVDVASFWIQAGWVPHRVAEEAPPVVQISHEFAVQVFDQKFQKFIVAEVICFPARAEVGQLTNARDLAFGEPGRRPNCRSFAPLRSTVSPSRT